MPPQSDHFQPVDLNSKTEGCKPDLEIERASLLALFRVMSLDDEEFRIHLETTARLSLELAVAAGLNPRDQERVWFAGLLHDTGKMGINRSILSKAGLLAPDEVDEVRLHTRIGHQILCSVPGVLYETAGEVALSHHERWDGKGYPDGIAGETISRESRIVAIADVFDCITAGRPYRKARSHDEASEELSRFAGTQFDPELVDLFLSEVLPNVPPG